MSGPTVTQIATKLPFETVKELLKSHCREPFTIMFAESEEDGADNDLVMNLIFADDNDWVRVRTALDAPVPSAG